MFKSLKLTRVQIITLILGIAFLTLYLIRGVWLPVVTDLLPIIEERSGLLEGLAAIFGFIGIAYTGFSYVYSVNKDEVEPFERGPLRPQTVEQLKSKYFADSQDVNWIDRKSTTVTDLMKHRRIVITGRANLGKTREAIELIRRAVAQSQIAPERIYEPTNELRLATTDDLKQFLERTIDTQTPILLLVDDLPFHYQDASSLQGLAMAVDLLTRSKSCYVIATARTEHVEGEHAQWFKKHNFEFINLPLLDDRQVGRLVDNAAGAFNLQVDDEAHGVLVSGSDQTPEHTIVSMRRLEQQGKQEVSLADAKQISGESTEQIWAEI